ncbi:MAG: bifunctional [glutamate--ammonia ligase]-adenylyl-L-tyrosine phosphorylase/[glutamate--ammonia-ligase] adenylyltransferase [Pseudomonadota bacterium]
MSSLPPLDDAALAGLPAPLLPLLRTHWAHYVEALAAADLPLPDTLSGDVLRGLLRVWAGSDYVAAQCARRPALLASLLAGGETGRRYAPGELRARIAAALAGATDDDALAAALRQVRHREMVRIIWRDLAGLADLAETTGDLSDLADGCIDLALESLAHQAEHSLGVPTGEQSGTPQKLVVIAMGKLGARELNLSSDVDLIFAYPEEGETRGAASALSNHEFFTRLGRRLIRALDTATDDGFVFRVDMRLRPWGTSGALAASFDALEGYYEEQGRPWERYAMIKARICAGDPVAGEELLRRLRPFVYRRYLDYSAFGSLRELKSMIAREVQRKGMAENVKLGPGGIREVEFIAQAFQLIRGGLDPRLQQRGLVPVLDTLAELGVLTPAARDELVAANDFLRRTEHRLQAIADMQTQTLPDDELTRLRIAFAMGCSDWPAFVAALDAHRARVERHFRDTISLPDDEAGAPVAGDEWLDLWLGRLPEPAAVAALAAQSLSEPGRIVAALTAFREDRAVINLPAISRERLDRLMPMLLRALPSTASVDVLPRVLKVVAAVLRRSAYMVLLCENPQALAELLRLCGASEWIADEIARHPSLLDELINTRRLYAPPQLDDLRADLRAQLARVPEDDSEQLMEVLRHFRLAHVLKVAASDVMETLPLMKVSDYLTWIAEALIGEVLAIAWRDVTARHGRPCDADGRPVGTAECAGFAVVAYGKLGGIELSYGSDLDLVFLYDAPADGSTDGPRELANEAFYTRLVQRIINLLTTRTFSGELYEVDMRLRPSGASGLMVSSLKAFARYQQETAWTWEHQALARARPVAGDPAVAERFREIRHETLARPRDPERLRNEVAAMRDRMVEHLGLAADKDATAAEKAGLFDVKHDPGGIVDIEFLVQYLVLRWSCEHPGLTRYTDNVRQLEGLAAAGLLPAADADLLREAYLRFRTLTHRAALAKGKSRVVAATQAELRAEVRRVWLAVIGETAADAKIH